VDEIFDKIVAINKKGTTVLLVEQNASEALEIADFAYVLEVGYTTISGSAGTMGRPPAPVTVSAMRAPRRASRRWCQ